MHEGVAKLIGTIPGLTYDELGPSNVFLMRMPSGPDNAVAVYPQASSEPDSLLPYDPAEWQVVVRGEADGVWALATGRAIFDKLHGKRNFNLPDGTYVVSIIALTSSPFDLGDDDSGRVQYSWDYRGEWLNPTEERPV